MTFTTSTTSPATDKVTQAMRTPAFPSTALSPFDQPSTPIMAQAHVSPRSQGPSKARSPSPSYFGFQSSNTLPVSTYGGQHTRQNWSPPSSAVRSAAANSPTFVPVDQNPDFAAFRRQSEGLGRTFTLSSFHSFTSQDAVASPRTQQERAVGEDGNTKPKDIKSPPMRPGPFVFGQDNTVLGRSPKRHLSHDSTNFPAAIRRSSPATDEPSEGSTSSPAEEAAGHMFALPSPVIPASKSHPAPATSHTQATEGFLITPEHVVSLLKSEPDAVLLLDLRVVTQYARSRISGALNLCIPTTLMKRPSFNVGKLIETFKSIDQRSKFEQWQSCKYIIVYDTSASQLKDAAICINTIKKFESEGYSGTAYIIQGGFMEFSKQFPTHVDKSSSASGGGPPGKLTMPGANEPLPVIGGCPMPATKSAANPFFGNIRQNMDLIGGVGQMPINVPDDLTAQAKEHIPAWLNKAASVQNNGAEVSDKFLHIEQREQKRMQNALSGEVSYGTPSTETAAAVQIAGIEKGAKNRYNNIWPFEHSRVKLEGVPSHECDYVNANHISSSLSHKRYIATQGPIPATFADFWNVVWQQDVRVIVMLTAEKEGGQIKAHDYWSDSEHGPFRLHPLSTRKATLDPHKIHRHRTRTSRKSSVDEKPLATRTDSASDDAAPLPLAKDEPYVIVRRLALSHSSFPFEPMREITQLQYSSWPDFGAPAHPSHLLGLVEQCDSVVRSLSHTAHADPDPPSSRPVLVHCSAGCGRTGTFCTVDSVIDMLKRQRKARSPSSRAKPAPASNPFFNAGATDGDVEGDWQFREDVDLIEKSVEDFRRQRLSMVQSLRQFVLCYETVLEWFAEEQRRVEIE